MILVSKPTSTVNPEAITKKYGNAWCMLVSTEGVHELNAFADKIGISRSWRQGGIKPYYALTEKMANGAVRSGARRCDIRECVIKRAEAKSL